MPFIAYRNECELFYDSKNELFHDKSEMVYITKDKWSSVDLIVLSILK